MSNYISSETARRRLSEATKRRAPASHRFDRNRLISDPSTVQVFDLCQAIQRLCIEDPHFLPDDLSNLISHLTLLHYHLHQSHLRRQEQESRTAAAISRRSSAPTRFRRLQPNTSYQPPITDDSIPLEVLERELARRKAAKP